MTLIIFLGKLGRQTKLGKNGERGVRNERVSSQLREEDFGSAPNIQGRSPGLRKSGERSFSGAVSLN